MTPLAEQITALTPLRERLVSSLRFDFNGENLTPSEVPHGPGARGGKAARSVYTHGDGVGGVPSPCPCFSPPALNEQKSLFSLLTMVEAQCLLDQKSSLLFPLSTQRAASPGTHPPSGSPSRTTTHLAPAT